MNIIAIFAVMNTAWAVVKKKKNMKKVQACTGFGTNIMNGSQLAYKLGL